MSLQLGPFQVDHPFILAPMAGITHSPYRRLMKRHQSALVVSELVSANGLEYASERTQQMLDFHDEERVVGIQIFGERVDLLCEAARRIEKLGADFVDLNLGCPVNKIVKKGAGSAMCKDPIQLGKNLKAIVDSISIPFTIKIRTGWDSHSINAHEVVQVATDAGVRWVAVHGRTRAQGYSGEADWDFIGEVKAKASIPIIGNGDIKTPEEAVRRVRDYGVDAAMIGRGALRNPFIFEQAQACWKGESFSIPSSDEYLDLMREQKDLLHDTFDEKGAMVHARKFVSWYSAGYPGSSEFRKSVFTIKEPEAFWDMSFEFFEKSIKNRGSDYLSQPFLMGGHG